MTRRTTPLHMTRRTASPALLRVLEEGGSRWSAGIDYARGGDAGVFLHWTVDATRLLEEARRVAVAELRGQGVSWREIGRLLQMTAQGVQQRYGS